MAIERVSETVSLGPRPGHVQTSVCSFVQYDGFRRHKAEVTFRPHLSPVKYADTVYVYINSTRKRFLSKTFYEPRIKPKSYSETTYSCPKAKQELFVTYLDQNPDDNRKWFKTAVEIKARRFRSAQTIPSPTDINSNSLTAIDQTLEGQRLNDDNERISNDASQMNGDILPRNQGKFQEKYDPGASQVYIPKRRDISKSDDQHGMLNQQLIMKFPNADVDFVNGFDDDDDDCTDV